jgi:hypothetical protein
MSDGEGRAGTGSHLLWVAATILAVAAFALRPIHSFDVFWYLRAGAEIVARGALPAHDPFSFTASPHWMNHEWLAEILLYLVHQLGGISALALLPALVLFVAFWLLLGPTRREARACGVPLAITWPVALGLGGAGLVLGEIAEPRAQLFSWVLFAATFALCLADARTPSPWIAAALPLQLIWTNLHGGNPTGVALLGLHFLFSPGGARLRGRRALVAGAAAVLTLAGPYGWKVHGHFLSSHQGLAELREWLPLTGAIALGSYAHLVYLGVVAAAAISLLVRRRQGSGAPFSGTLRFEAAALVVFLLLSIRYARFSGEACLVAAAIFLRAGLRPGRAPAAAAPLAALGLLLVAGALLPSARTFGLGLAPGRHPIAAVAWLRAHRPPGPMFNSFNFGGYLQWAYPEEKVFIDGRAFTVYPDDLFAEMLAVYAQPTRFRDLEQRFNLRLAVVQTSGRGASFLAWLRQQPDWNVRYQDARATILTRR